jgi:DNA-binding IclR family transcriptional regulator
MTPLEASALALLQAARYSQFGRLRIPKLAAAMGCPAPEARAALFALVRAGEVEFSDAGGRGIGALRTSKVRLTRPPAAPAAQRLRRDFLPLSPQESTCNI